MSGSRGGIAFAAASYDERSPRAERPRPCSNERATAGHGVGCARLLSGLKRRPGLKREGAWGAGRSWVVCWC
jgi:hypothetical protein